MTRASGAAEAFELVGHPDRLSIIETLIETRWSGEDPHVRFTDLRKGSEVDDAGRFNYHLHQLLGTFVTKTDEGYRISSYAHRIMAPMMGGVYDPERAGDAIPTPGGCPECGADLQIRPSETVLQLVCEQDHVINRGLLGYPGVVGDPPRTRPTRRWDCSTSRERNWPSRGPFRPVTARSTGRCAEPRSVGSTTSRLPAGPAGTSSRRPSGRACRPTRRSCASCTTTGSTFARRSRGRCRFSTRAAKRSPRGSRSDRPSTSIRAGRRLPSPSTGRARWSRPNGPVPASGPRQTRTPTAPAG